MDKLKSMLHLIHESCCTMITSWEDTLSSNDGSAEIDVWPYLETLTGDIISRVAFGSTYEEGRKTFGLLKEQVELSLSNVQLSNYIPGWRFLPTKKNRRVKEICKEIEESLTRIIDSRKKEAEDGVEANMDDLLGILLESNIREIKEHGNIRGRGLTTKEVIEECKTFYLAGSETTSNLLVWALILLCKHPIWQEQARAEVLQVLGKNRIPDFQGLNQLKIVTMILYETLRVYSPSYMFLRKVYVDTKLRDVLIPAGTELVLPLCMIHQGCNLWGKDAKVFNPERFSEGVLQATKGKPIYFPFSTGPRSCIGQNLSLLEAKMTLALILQRFSFTLSPTYIHAPIGNMTVRPQHGANLTLTRLM